MTLEYQIGSGLRTIEGQGALTDEYENINRGVAVSNLVRVALSKHEDSALEVQDITGATLYKSHLFLNNNGLLAEIVSNKPPYGREEIENLKIAFYLIPGAELDFEGKIFEIEIPGNPNNVNDTVLRSLAKYNEDQFNIASEVLHDSQEIDQFIYRAALSAILHPVATDTP